MPPTETRLMVGETAASAVAAQAKASVEARYLMALQRPRNWLDVSLRLNEVCKRPGVAEAAEWSIKRGGKTLNGPTIRFAEEALRAAGNILSEATVVFDDDEKRIVRITMTDLEVNWSIYRDIALSKTVERREVREGQKVIGKRTNSEGVQVYVVQATEDDLLMKQNAQVSKVMRTDGLRLIPTDVKEDALAIAAETRRNKDAKDPADAAKRIGAKFFGLGVSVEQLEAFVGKPLASVQPVDVERLRMVYAALAEGETTWAELTDTTPREPSDAKTGTDRLREKLDQAKGKKEPAS